MLIGIQEQLLYSGLALYVYSQKPVFSWLCYKLTKDRDNKLTILFIEV